MGWRTTFDADQFAAAASGYLGARAAENSLLLSGAQAARDGGHGPLLGWWEPPDGGAPRGAFLHDQAVPLLIAGRAPELGAALAATLAKTGRQVCGVDAPTEVADAFAAAWSQRAGTAVLVHRNCRVYRLGGPDGLDRPVAGAWPPPAAAPDGRLRCAVPADRALLTEWLAAAAAEMAERTTAPADLAAELISYGGAVLWEAPWLPEGTGGAGRRPVALATLGRPVAGTVRIAMVYTPPACRRHGYATALTLAVTSAVLAGAGLAGTGLAGTGLAGTGRGATTEVVLITDRSRSDRWGSRLGYQLVSERAVLRFGPAAGGARRPRMTGGLPRLPTGPLPRLPRLRG